jgi:hypothetical protein
VNVETETVPYGGEDVTIETTVPDDIGVRSIFENLSDRELLIVVAEQQHKMNETLDHIFALVDGVKDQVQPLLEKIMAHPMAKMFGVK